MLAGGLGGAASPGGAVSKYQRPYYGPPLKEGLKEVPYDDYPARLHKGERVLTREEAARYNEMEARGLVNR
jgi:hypothetical protein